ncbi:unnamed protein product [Prunus armeniaca]
MFQEEQLEKEENWRKLVKEKIGEGSNIKDLKDYAIIFGELYRRFPGGILTQCIGAAEAQRRLLEVQWRTIEMLGRTRLESEEVLAGNTYWRVRRAPGNEEASRAATELWILTATKYFTKWVEAIPLQEYIVCRFGIPYKIVTNNGTPFVNKQVSSTLSGHGIKHRHSTLLAVVNLMAWCSGPRGCASTRDVLLLDAVRLCAGVPARSTVRRDDDEVRVEDG